MPTLSWLTREKDVKSAERLLGMALKGDPSLRALAERLMPGLVQ